MTVIQSSEAFNQITKKCQGFGEMTVTTESFSSTKLLENIQFLIKEGFRQHTVNMLTMSGTLYSLYYLSKYVKFRGQIEELPPHESALPDLL